jgi:hypothetical protein
MDMWDRYVTSTLKHLPEAQRKIVGSRPSGPAAGKNSFARRATIDWPALATIGCGIRQASDWRTERNSPLFATAI